MPLDLTNGRLSPAQLDRYWADGFLHPLQGLTAADAAQARRELETIERDWLDADLPQPLATYKRLNSHIVMPLAARIGHTPRILDAVEGVLGPDVMLYSAELFIKEPRTAHVVTMHQDLTYWGMGAIDGLVTAWLALSPATRASGCMDFVRASHKNAILPHTDTYDDTNLLSRGQEIAVDVDAADREAIELAPGEFSLHHGLTIHGSGPNASDDRRIGLVFRYVRPDMAREDGGKDPAMLVRGQDAFGNFEHVPAPRANFEPGALALHERIRRDQAAVMMAGAKAGSTGGMYD